MFAMDTCAAVRRFVFVEGKSLREAARVFGLSRDTIAKMCRYSAPLGYVRSKPPERPKLGPLAPVIDAVLEADKTAPATDGEADFRTAADRTWLRWRLHPSPYRKTRSDWHIAGNRAMLRPMGDMLKTDLVSRRRPVPIKGLARSGDPDAAPSAQCAAKKSAEAARPQQFRSSGFCRLQLDCAARCECLGDRRARRRLSGGIVPVFVRSGDGSRDVAAADQVPLEIRQLFRATCGALPGSMAKSSSSALRLGKPRSPNTWQGTGDPHLKAGRRSSATTPMGLHRLTCLSFHQHEDHGRERSVGLRSVLETHLHADFITISSPSTAPRQYYFSPSP
jgi:hypothetical protein